ncbi:MAG TPA: hypothetical protein VES91_10190 [Burkholderiaceae bacterium]|nr:hypothetical protein [Burkholderiaceae bacterium]
MTSRTPLHTLVALTLAAIMLPCSAQLRLDVMPETAFLSAQNRTLSGDALSFQASAARSFSGTSASGSSWLGTAIQLEAPRATGTGQYTRPKFHVGVPSESMRGFLNSAGFTADKCQLPMVRARTKSSGDGDINGTLWLYARCTFH